MSQPGSRLYSMYARSDRGCKGELAQSQQVPERSEWSSTKEIVSLEAELKQAKREITDLKEKMGWLKNHCRVFTLDEDVLKVEAGLSTRDIFNSVDSYAERLKDQINYLGGWGVEIFITSIKVREDYWNLHLAQLFGCVYPQLQILLPHWSMLSIQFTDLMKSIPSRDKNKLSAPSSFNQVGSGRVIIDCTDIEIITPG